MDDLISKKDKLASSTSKRKERKHYVSTMLSLICEKRSNNCRMRFIEKQSNS
uniref:Uncharacterized protein n=1 Tax=Rhizophagus irregularis (strain DAOM 181602 / DAOM 197198 / MUCL 43194) TaxID=747089 RepID=U9T6Y5_RHIID